MSNNSNKSKINKAYAFMQNDTKKALKIFNEILKDEPYNIEAINGKGSSLMKLNRFDEANECFDKSLSIKVNSSALINKGIIEKTNQNYQDALNYYNRAIQLSPELTNIINILKKEVLDINDKKPLNLNKYTTQANDLIKKGKDYQKENKLWDALECYKKAIEADYTCKNVVKIYIDEIKNIFHNEFSFRTPKFNNTEIDKLKIQSLQTLLIEENPKKALTLMNLILEIDENDLDTLNHKGCLLFLFDKCDESIKCFDKCLKIDAKYYHALFNKGLVLRRLNKLNEALECFDEVLKVRKHPKKAKSYQLEILDKLHQTNN